MVSEKIIITLIIWVWVRYRFLCSFCRSPGVLLCFRRVWCSSDCSDMMDIVLWICCGKNTRALVLRVSGPRWSRKYEGVSPISPGWRSPTRFRSPWYALSFVRLSVGVVSFPLPGSGILFLSNSSGSLSSWWSRLSIWSIVIFAFFIGWK